MIPAAVRRCLTGLLLAVATDMSAVEEPAPDKSHVLFMGVDLAVQQGKRFHQVEDVDGSEFVIKVDGKNRFVRTRMRSSNLKINPGLKLVTTSVQLADLQSGPGYTPANDPRHKFNARSGAAGGAAAASDLANYQAAEISNALEIAKAAPEKLPTQIAELERMLEGAQSVQTYANDHTGSDFGSTPNMANQLALELAEGNYDLVDVSFRISSPVPLDDPYMVVLVEFQLRDAKPGDTSMLIHAQALDPIGPEPKYVRVREGGLPVGFKFGRCEVHIYNRGKEVATNASSKRVELTREEARQYLLLDHVGTHKKATLPATAVAGSLSPALRARLGRDQLDRICYARVSKEGRLIGTYADESCSLPLADPDLVAVLEDAFFKPALAEGKPQDGVARVRLGDLTF